MTLPDVRLYLPGRRIVPLVMLSKYGECGEGSGRGAGAGAVPAGPAHDEGPAHVGVPAVPDHGAGWPEDRAG